MSLDLYAEICKPIGPGPRELASNLLGSAPAWLYEGCCRDRLRVGERRLGIMTELPFAVCLDAEGVRELQVVG
jgi:hypothetical protein